MAVDFKCIIPPVCTVKCTSTSTQDVSMYKAYTGQGHIKGDTILIAELEALRMSLYTFYIKLLSYMASNFSHSVCIQKTAIDYCTNVNTY